jgi:hypothetical protein
MKIISTVSVLILTLVGTPEEIRAQAVATTGYVTRKAGLVYAVENGQSALLNRPLSLTPELTVLTNGVITIASDGEEELAEGRRVSLDGFWMGEDGTLLVFKPHYLFKERMLFFVESGVLTKVDQDVTLKNGAVLCTDATLLTPSGRLVRLDDGHMLTVNGDPIPGLDHVAIADGKLVLQKDGSIIPLPVVSTIGMSDGTRVRGDGLITWPSGYEFMLSEGQRLTVEGAAMPNIQ